MEFKKEPIQQAKSYSDALAGMMGMQVPGKVLEKAVPPAMLEKAVSSHLLAAASPIAKAPDKENKNEFWQA